MQSQEIMFLYMWRISLTSIGSDLGIYLNPKDNTVILGRKYRIQACPKVISINKIHSPYTQFIPERNQKHIQTVQLLHETISPVFRFIGRSTWANQVVRTQKHILGWNSSAFNLSKVFWKIWKVCYLIYVRISSTYQGSLRHASKITNNLTKFTLVFQLWKLL